MKNEKKKISATSIQNKLKYKYEYYAKHKIKTDHGDILGEKNALYFFNN
jgi:hypothetical protein